MSVTILGGEGFIGRRLRAECERRGFDVKVPPRGALPQDEDLGHVFYCIGVTADFRSRPFDTVEAHVHALARWLQAGRFETFLYLSSTRIYGGLEENSTAHEEVALPVTPSADSLYNLSKLLGEALCLSDARSGVRVARIANVYGPAMSDKNFLGSVIAEARREGTVTILEDPSSSKDYIHVDDVVGLLLSISLRGCHRIYNVASGTATTHAEIARLVREEFGATVDFRTAGVRRCFPTIDIGRICDEFDFHSRPLSENLADLTLLTGEPKGKPPR